MELEQLYDFLDIEHGGQFEYFENFADLVETPAEIASNSTPVNLRRDPFATASPIFNVSLLPFSIMFLNLSLLGNSFFSSPNKAVRASSKKSVFQALKKSVR